MDSKAWWKSKTMWLNVAVVAAGIADQLITGGLIPPAWIPSILSAIGIANVVLLSITTQPLTVSAE